jgi:hypothetical protein
MVKKFVAINFFLAGGIKSGVDVNNCKEEAVIF